MATYINLKADGADCFESPGTRDTKRLAAKFAEGYDLCFGFSKQWAAGGKAQGGMTLHQICFTVDSSADDIGLFKAMDSNSVMEIVYEQEDVDSDTAENFIGHRVIGKEGRLTDISMHDMETDSGQSGGGHAQTHITLVFGDITFEDDRGSKSHNYTVRKTSK